MKAYEVMSNPSCKVFPNIEPPQGSWYLTQDVVILRYRVLQRFELLLIPKPVKDIRGLGALQVTVVDGFPSRWLVFWRVVVMLDLTLELPLHLGVYLAR